MSSQLPAAVFTRWDTYGKFDDLFVVSVVLYGSETWTMCKVDSDRIQSFHMQTLRRILGIRWYDKVSNAVVNERTKLPDSYCWQTSFIIWSHLSPTGEHTCLAGTATQANSAFHPYGVDKSSTNLPGWGESGAVTSVGWQITLCDPIDKWRPVVLRWISRRTIRSFTFTFKIIIASCHLLLYVVYTCQNHLILLKRSIVTSKNVSWLRLIWPTL